LLQPEFPTDIPVAIEKGVKETDEQFVKMLFDEFKEKFERTKNRIQSVDRAGSCAIVLFVVDKQLYIVNVGDSRAFCSKDQGKLVEELSTDHKPDEPNEKERIVSNGGKIYQSQVNVPAISTTDPVWGPLRVFPGRLSVSRTFGDIEAKVEELGGLPKVVVCDP